MVLLGRWLCERLLPFKKKRKSCTPVESLVDTRALSRSLSVENEWLLGRRFWLFAKLIGGTGIP
jgi:hypothetical protein